MYINEVHELVQALAQASMMGKVHSVQVARVEDIGIHVTEKLGDIGISVHDVAAGEVSDSTFIACVNAALRDMV